MINLSTHRRAAAINDQRRSTRNAQSGLIRAVLAPSWSITALVAAAFVAGISLPPWAVYVPFVASVLLFGLPHGAADHVVIPRVLGQRPRLVSVLIICVGYLALAGAYLAFWFWAPAPAFAMFILMMWWHWGQGDLYALLGFIGAGHLRTHSQRGAALAIRGGLPMLVPLLAFPAVYQAGAHDMIGLFSPHAAAHGAWLWANPFRLTVGNVFVVLMVGTLLLGYRGAGSGERTAWVIDAGETLLLALYFTVVPPLLAIRLYFCVWHAPRHIARLVLLDRQAIPGTEQRSLRLAITRFARDAAPTTLAAPVLLGGLYLVVPNRPDSLPALVALYLRWWRH